MRGEDLILVNGDCLKKMAEMEPNSVDAIVTDPPYGLSFMSKDWDYGVPGVAFWAEALRVAKPGAMLLAFGGTRTFHRLTCAIEDAGWQVRDVLSWLYGSGFPKSLDISKAIDKVAGVERDVVGRVHGRGSNSGEGRYNWNNPNDTVDRTWYDKTIPATDASKTWEGWGTGLKPAWEPIILAMKPLDGTFANNALTWGVAGLNVEGCRIPITDGAKMARNNKPGANGWKNSSGGPSSAALNGEPSGRWPANLVLDEEAALLLDEQSGVSKSPTKVVSGAKSTFQATGRGQGLIDCYGDTGGASRFFYVAKASRSERNIGLEGMGTGEIHTTHDKHAPDVNGGDSGYVGGNHHPTVKPLTLMRYLVRLVSTPTGGVILDPFMGSGTTGVACALEGVDFIGIELDKEYVEIAEKRIASVNPA